MRKFKQIIFVFSALLILFAQFACQKKQNIENTNFLKKAEVTDSYKKYLLVLWRDFDPQKEDILKLANQQDSAGGITLAEIKFTFPINRNSINIIRYIIFSFLKLKIINL